MSYSPPDNDNVDFRVASSYTPPGNDNADFGLSVAIVSAEITTPTSSVAATTPTPLPEITLSADITTASILREDIMQVALGSGDISAQFETQTVGENTLTTTTLEITTVTRSIETTTSLRESLSVATKRAYLTQTSVSQSLSATALGVFRTQTIVSQTIDVTAEIIEVVERALERDIIGVERALERTLKASDRELQIDR